MLAAFVFLKHPGVEEEAVDCLAGAVGEHPHLEAAVAEGARNLRRTAGSGP